jgi:hypothetical protein
VKWILWALILIAQNAAFTWVSRARNSGSVSYHATASVFSNAIWFVSNLILVDSIVTVARSADVFAVIQLGLFYTACTVIGSVLMHWFSVRYLETGKRKVGA